jgi:hypothetical protein
LGVGGTRQCSRPAARRRAPTLAVAVPGHNAASRGPAGGCRRRCFPSAASSGPRAFLCYRKPYLPVLAVSAAQSQPTPTSSRSSLSLSLCHVQRRIKGGHSEGPRTRSSSRFVCLGFCLLIVIHIDSEVITGPLHACECFKLIRPYYAADLN